MATLFKMFADPTRLKIMNVLLNNELNVCEIAYLLNMTHSAISHQLATLKLSNLVKSTKKGKEVYYSLADEHISSILAIGKEHVEE
jgi:ArsR family transcriptional regulator